MFFVFIHGLDFFAPLFDGLSISCRGLLRKRFLYTVCLLGVRHDSYCLHLRVSFVPPSAGLTVYSGHISSMSWAGAGGPARPDPSFFHVVGRGPAQPMASPSIFQRMGRGPAQPINFSDDRLRPGPSIFKFSWPGPDHDVHSKAHEIRAYMGRPVDLTGRPMCHPVLTLIIRQLRKKNLCGAKLFPRKNSRFGKIRVSFGFSSQNLGLGTG